MMAGSQAIFPDASGTMRKPLKNDMLINRAKDSQVPFPKVGSNCFSSGR